MKIFKIKKLATKQDIETIYTMLTNLNSKERLSATEARHALNMANSQVERLMIESDYKDDIILRQDQEIQRLDKLLKEQEKLLKTKDKEQKKLHGYLEKVAEILKNQQAKIINKPKIAKTKLMTEKMLKISDEAKAKLK